mmetsp:Transcript_27154/g.77084  ORF Transcript_27154/g.77084 Transcript_27154/m.77084 type:complete len:340 (+) Transcript_27154:317-1336(+)
MKSFPATFLSPAASSCQPPCGGMRGLTSRRPTSGSTKISQVPPTCNWAPTTPSAVARSRSSVMHCQKFLTPFVRRALNSLFLASTQVPCPTNMGMPRLFTFSWRISAAAMACAAAPLPVRQTSQMQAFHMKRSRKPLQSSSACRMRSSVHFADSGVVPSCARAAGGGLRGLTKVAVRLLRRKRFAASSTWPRPGPTGTFHAGASNGGTEPSGAGTNSSSGMPLKLPQKPLWPSGWAYILITADIKSTPVAVISMPCGSLKRKRPPRGSPWKRPGHVATEKLTGWWISRIDWSWMERSQSDRRAAHKTNGASNSALPSSSWSSKMGWPSYSTRRPPSVLL